MSNKIINWSVCLGIGLASSVVALGCVQREKPVPFSEYGETIDHAPVVQDLPSSFPIADEIEKSDCHIREEAEREAKHRLFESQGRSLELGDDEHDHDH